MANDVGKEQKSAGDEGYESQNREQIDAARKAGNVWKFEGREMEMFVARGEASVATNIVRTDNEDDTGAKLVHKFKWDAPDAFVLRENAFKTNLSRVGRRQEQKISTVHIATVNAEFYRKIVSGGVLLKPGANGRVIEQEISQQQMIEHSMIYPESASEAIETWLDAPFIKRQTNKDNFEFLFSVPEHIKVMWSLGDEQNPSAAGLFTFAAPSSEERAAYDLALQTVETKRRGDVSSTDIEENFLKKIQYGGKHLLDVEGIAVGEEGVKFEKSLKEKLITLFGPIWFGDIVDVMHSTFDFMKGRSEPS